MANLGRRDNLALDAAGNQRTVPGVPCFPANAVQALVPLENVDSLFLTWLLQPGIGGSSGTADFFNSDDFSITVPNGTIIMNNPGGSLFQTPTASVREANSSLLIGSGLALAVLFGKRNSRGGSGDPTSV